MRISIVLATLALLGLWLIWELIRDSINRESEQEREEEFQRPVQRKV